MNQSSYRLLRERLVHMLRQAELTSGELPDNNDTVRLAAAALSLLERHEVDHEGRRQRGVGHVGAGDS